MGARPIARLEKSRKLSASLESAALLLPTHFRIFSLDPSQPASIPGVASQNTDIVLESAARPEDIARDIDRDIDRDIITGLGGGHVIGIECHGY